MRYSQVLNTVRRLDDAWTAEAGDDWSQGRTVFGGLQAALAVRAMRDLVPQSIPLRVLQTSFIAPVPPGPLRIEARVLRSGKSVTQVEARIVDEGQTACLVVGIFGQSRSSTIEVQPPKPQVPSADAAELFPYLEGITPVFTRQVIMRWARGITFLKGAQATTPIYVGFRDEAYAGPGALGEAQIIGYADIIPPPGMSLLTRPAAVSSLTWTLELLTDDCGPAREGLWLMDAAVDAGRDGYLNQSAILWSPEWQPVALSRQSVVVFA
ncbi:MAG: acyl-CoA thioesterase [Lysobacter sp.]